MKRVSIVISSIFSLLGVFCLGIVTQASAQYPIKPITMVVPNTPGDDADILVRPLCQKASAILGKPIIVVNKPGAGSTIGFREVYGAKPDGYTIGIGHATIFINKLAGLIPYDHEDFTVLGTYATFIPVIVSSTKTQRPFKKMDEVISFAKSHPGEVSIATTAVGGSWWVATMAFQEGTGLKFNVIPQAGGGGVAIAQVAGGHTDLAVLAVAAAKSQMEAGNVSLLAVFGSKRFPEPYNNVPSLKEMGYDIGFESTQVLIGPPKMPKDISEKLVNAFKVAANDPEYQKFVVERTAIPYILSPEEAIKFLNDRRKIVRSIMQKAGVLKGN